MPQAPISPEYLGDSVYIRFDEVMNMFALTTDSHEESAARNIIFLEFGTAKKIQAYVERTELHYANA